MRKYRFRILFLCSVLSLMVVVAQLNADNDAPIFVDVSEKAGITATHLGIWDPEESLTGYLAIGQAWGDYDRDGWVDLYVTGNLDPNVLYRNNQDGSFSISEFSQSLSLPDSSERRRGLGGLR